MIIRPATPPDEAAIHRLYLESFDPSEREIVAELAIKLLSTKSTPVTHSLVADLDDTIIGHVSFSPVWQSDCENMIGYTLAPLAVSPSQQRQGIGALLVEHGIELLKQQSVSLLLVYGDPNYYGRFGFTAEVAKGYTAPHPLQYDFGWQAMHLSGQFRATPPCKLKCVAALDDPTLW